MSPPIINLDDSEASEARVEPSVPPQSVIVVDDAEIKPFIPPSSAAAAGRGVAQSRHHRFLPQSPSTPLSRKRRRLSGNTEADVVVLVSPREDDDSSVGSRRRRLPATGLASVDVIELSPTANPPRVPVRPVPGVPVAASPPPAPESGRRCTRVASPPVSIQPPNPNPSRGIEIAEDLILPASPLFIPPSRVRNRRTARRERNLRLGEGSGGANAVARRHGVIGGDSHVDMDANGGVNLDGNYGVNYGGIGGDMNDINYWGGVSVDDDDDDDVDVDILSRTVGGGRARLRRSSRSNAVLDLDSNDRAPEAGTLPTSRSVQNPQVGSGAAGSGSRLFPVAQSGAAVRRTRSGSAAGFASMHSLISTMARDHFRRRRGGRSGGSGQMQNLQNYGYHSHSHGHHDWSLYADERTDGPAFMHVHSHLHNHTTHTHNEDMSYERLLRLDESVSNKHKAAPASVIRSLPLHRATEDDTAISCCICMEDVKVGEELRTLPCEGLHKFHKVCIDKWLQKNGTCPVDKFRVGGRGDPRW